MRKLFTLIVLAFAAFSAQAQTNEGKVEGLVRDGNGKMVEGATVTLLKAKDSSIAKVGIVDKSGKFVFEALPAGSYLVSVSAVGHVKGFSPKFELSETASTVSLKAIELLPQAKTAAGVVVTAKRPLIEQKIDRTVVNVEASVTNVGNSALEVLEKSPGISVDKDGNISLKGKEGVIVLVDGRPTQLGAADLANMLRSMQASQLDQIEIMTNPPARFDAAGNAGVINIKTKKNKQFGYNGTFTLGYGQGRYPKFNESLNLNYRHGKWNLFSNLSHNYRKNFQELDIQRTFRNSTTKELLSHFDQEARMRMEFNSYNAKLGADFSPGKNTTLGVVLGGFYNGGTFINRNTNLIADADGNLVTLARAISSSDEDWKNYSANLNFRQVLDTSGKELTADLDWITYRSGNGQYMINEFFNAAGDRDRPSDILYGELPQNIHIYSGRADYLQPLKKGARFEAGIKSSIVRTDNRAKYDVSNGNVIVNDPKRTNDFLYEENINAAYVNLSRPFSKKLSAQLGLRLENTNAKGFSAYFLENQDAPGTFYADDSTFTRNYTQLFPTAFLQYTLDKKNTIGLNYGRRIRRPNYESLNPFIEYLDRYTYMQGNPNLKPQFSHNIELSHSFRNFLTTTLNYTKTTDVIQQVMEQIEDSTITYVKRDNIAAQRQYGVSVSANMPITKWWSSNLYVNVFNNYFEGMVGGTYIAVDATQLMLNGSQTFKLGKTTSAEVSGFFRTGGVEGVLRMRNFGMMAVGFSQQIMKNKGSLRLNIRDVFYLQKFRADVEYGNVDTHFQSRNDTRVVNLAFTYRFSKGKINGAPKRRASSASDEQSRVDGGNN